jgi:hypothetical protein
MLERTMSELATRYRIGEGLGDARSAKEWTTRTMLEVFGTTLEQLQRAKEPPYPPAEPAPARVFRVKAPQLSPAPPPTDPALPPGAPPVHTVPQGAIQLDTKSANAMVESYAEAASTLADHISELKEQSQNESRKVETYRAVADVAKKLFSATPDETPALLERVVSAIAQSLRCGQASLSLVRPDGNFEQVVGLGLPVDPLEGARTPGGRPLAQALVDGQRPMLQLRGEAGPLEDAMDRAGLECVAVLALPMVTPVHAVGLLTFYFPQETPAPTQETIEHLERVALELTMALEVISDAHASESLKQSLRSAFRGRVAEGAAYGLDVPIAGIDASIVRIRGRVDVPPFIQHELTQIESALAHVKFMRQTLLDLRSGRLPGRVPTPLNEILARLESELAPALTEQGIRFLVEIKPGVRPVYAEPFLLRGLLYTIIDNSRRRLAGAGGGVIRILVQADTHGARLSIFDNLIAVSNALSAPARFLAWPLERRLTDVTNELMQSVVEYFQGRWAEETRETIGTVRTIVLPTT